MEYVYKMDDTLNLKVHPNHGFKNSVIRIGNFEPTYLKKYTLRTISNWCIYSMELIRWGSIEASKSSGLCPTVYQEKYPAFKYKKYVFHKYSVFDIKLRINFFGLCRIRFYIYNRMSLK